MTNENHRIIWIDDEIELLKSHILYLESRGYEFTRATNGPDALELIRSHHFDLVLLDEMMPVMDGLEVLKRIKSIKSDLPVVMVTKNEAEEIMEQAIGSQIDGYLTKPVNPSQVLSVLKRLLDTRAISTGQISQDWSMDMRELTEIIDSQPDSKGWIDLHARLCGWEHRFDQYGDPDLVEMHRSTRLEADRQFGRWVENEYPRWISSPPNERPSLSTDVVDNWLIPQLSSSEPVLFLVVDCMRLDQWIAIESLLAKFFEIRRDHYFSILPTATPYSRNALFSGLFPRDLERIHHDLWAKGDEDEASSNRYERNFMIDLLRRRGIEMKPDPKYVKVLEVDELAEFERRVQEYINMPLTAMVYNFYDILIHTRQSVEVLKEMLPDESAFRSITKAWFQHSALFRILQAYSEVGGTIVITSDHGSVRGRRGTQVIGDRDTSSSLRYKHGRNIKVNERHAIKIRDSESWGLPKLGVNTEYIIACEDYFFIYPTNYNKYLELYRNSFQHGGVSLDEMILPVVTLKGKG